MITDLRGWPALPDQAPFSARRRSVVPRGGIIANPPDVFSVRHPRCMNGNASSKFGQRIAVWLDFPQEKHTTSVQSRRVGRSRGGSRCRWRCPPRKECNICSSTVGTGGLTMRVADSVSPSPAAVAVFLHYVAVCIADGICRIRRIRIWLLIRRTAGSAWLSQTLHRSTTSLIGVSGDTLSKCRRRSQFLWLAINRSRIKRNRAVCPMSPKALTPNVSKAVANMAGSSPTVLVVLSNCLR